MISNTINMLFTVYISTCLQKNAFFPHVKIFYIDQCCARVSPGTQEPDPWEKIHQNRTRNRQKIKVSSRTGTGTAKRFVSVLKPEKALKGQHPPQEINEFFWGVY